MKTYKYFALICAAVVAAASTGCSNNSANSGSTGSSVTSTNDTSHTTSEAGTEDVKQSESYKTVKVTAVDGNTITADEGDIVSGGAPGQPGDGSAPEKPGDDSDDGSGAPEKPSDGSDKPEGEPPAKPDGDNSGDAPDQSGSGASDKPDGEAGSAPGGMGGSTFEASGSSMTFTVTDDTSISVEFLQGSSDGTAASVVVKNMNAGSGFGGSGEVTNGTSANTISENTTESDTEYLSTGDDENALRVDSAEVTLTNITVNKSAGSSSNTEDGDFYGQNAGFLALNGARVTIADSTFNTGVVNGNAVFSYGEGTTVNISDSKIRTTERNSGGIQTTGGGTMNATSLDVQTEGNSSAAIRTDRGGGTVNVEGGKYVTNGTGSPAIYCTADITASNAELTANASDGVVVEGKNSVTLNNCTLTGNMENTYGGDSDENIHTIMIYQSMSGDADIGEAYFTAEGGSITGLSGDMFYVTNTDCTISLKDVAFTLANDTFLRVEGNSSSHGWGTEGANGGDVILTAEDQTIEGNILVDSISGLDMTMTNSTFSGAINPDGEGGTVKVTMDGGSTWSLTGDSYVTEFSGDVSRITSNGYHLYVNGEQIV